MLPDQFVLRGTHGSGYNVIVKDKKTFDRQKAKKFVNRFLKENFYYLGREKNYFDIEPRVLCDKYIEGVADGQMLKFKKDPNNVGKINQTGLWKNSRHPNYFGEIAFWFSLFLFSMTISNRWVLLFCPLIVFLLFAFISIPMMEKRQLANKKGYDEYKKKTNLLLPIWPPQEKTNK